MHQDPIQSVEMILMLQGKLCTLHALVVVGGQQPAGCGTLGDDNGEVQLPPSNYYNCRVSPLMLQTNLRKVCG